MRNLAICLVISAAACAPPDSQTSSASDDLHRHPPHAPYTLSDMAMPNEPVDMAMPAQPPVSGEDGGTPAPPPVCAMTSSSYKTTDAYGYKNYGKYIVTNNNWGGMATQSFWANSEACWGVNIPGATKELNGVGSYPSVTRGWSANATAMQALSTAGTNDWTTKAGLGLAVATITKAKVHWAMTTPQTAGSRWMALQDIYFHKTATPSPTEFPPYTDLMIDQAIADNGYYAAVAAGDHAQSVTIGGNTFLLYIDDSGEAGFHNGGHTIHLFLQPTSGSFWGKQTNTLDLKAVIDYFRQSNLSLKNASGQTVTGPLITDDLYLTAINSGWETDVGTAYQTNDFWAAMQTEPDGN